MKFDTSGFLDVSEPRWVNFTDDFEELFRTPS